MRNIGSKRDADKVAGMRVNQKAGVRTTTLIHEFREGTTWIRTAKQIGKQVNLRTIIHNKSASKKNEANLFSVGLEQIFARSVFIFTTNQNRHSSSFGELDQVSLYPLE